MIISTRMMWWTTPAPGECAKGGSLNNESLEKVVHIQVSNIGADLAKNVFQVHGLDSAGKVVITRQLRRSRSSTSLVRFLLAWSAWKPAEPLIIGRVKFPSSVTLCV